MTHDAENNDDREDVFDLDGFFEAARGAPPEPSLGLMARVLADSEAARAVPPEPVRTSGIWRGLVALVGGWPAVSGLATAACVGLWIGISPPAGLTDIAETYLGIDAQAAYSDFLPSFDTEG